MKPRLQSRRSRLLLPFLLLGSAGLYAQEVPRVAAGSGAVQAAGTGIAVTGTIGQAIIGPVRTQERQTEQGFWTPARHSLSVAADPTAGETPLSSLSLQCLPNPVAKYAIIQATVPDGEPVTLTLHDLLGREVLRPARNEQAGTTASFALDASGLENGRYTLVLSAGAARTTLQVNIVR